MPLVDNSLRAVKEFLELLQLCGRVETPLIIGTKRSLNEMKAEKLITRRDVFSPISNLQAVFSSAADCKPSNSTAISRSRYFCTLPVTVIGNASTNRQ